MIRSRFADLAKTIPLTIVIVHYVGVIALQIPDGYFTLNIFLVILSGIISWVVCIIGCILMLQMETYLTQQFLFSAVATTGVAAMHFTGCHLPPHFQSSKIDGLIGMQAVTFWSTLPASETKGYPSALPIAIVSIAITTCIIANGLLAHAAIVSRNKLAEIVWTRRKLWR
jgi:NO-binding membrane sensor protein with MHYT domain